MPVKRIIPCLDVDKDVVVKGVNFRGLREVGDPASLAARYEEEGADELTLLDVTASIEGRRTFEKTVKEVARSVSIPLIVGGGVRSIEDADRLFRAGADKVSVNTAAVENPEFVKKLAEKYGSQSVVVAIDAKRAGGSWEVLVMGGRVPTGMDALEWARKAVELGAGELLVTSIDTDGTGMGYDVELYRRLSGEVSVPIIASGGAGDVKHFLEVLRYADAALAASLFHMEILTIGFVKEFLRRSGVPVRT